MSNTPTTHARDELDLHCQRTLAQFDRLMSEVEGVAYRGYKAAVERIDADLAVLRAQAPSWYRPLIDSIGTRLKLIEVEKAFLLACVAVAIQPGIPLHAFPDEELERGLTIDLFARLALGSDRAKATELALYVQRGALVQSGVLRPQTQDRTPVRVPYAPSPIVIAGLAGLGVEHPRISGVRWTRPERFIVDPVQTDALAEIESTRHHTRRLVLIEGAPGTGRVEAIAQMGTGLWSLDLYGLSADAARSALLDLRTIIRLVGGCPLLLSLDCFTDRERDAAVLGAVNELVEAVGVPVFAPVRGGSIPIPTTYSPRRIRWPKPGPATCARIWQEFATGFQCAITNDVATRLARRYPVGPGTISESIAIASRLVEEAADGKTELGEPALVRGLRSVAADELNDLGQVVTIRHEWSDLILPAAVREQVDLVVARGRAAERVLGDWGFGDKIAGGAGTVVLLSGQPGTGKTMLAGLIARELGRELLAVDLSRVLSKWVGETEQRLARVFDAAEAGHLALVIDEADALFGQRASRIETASDRFSNLEINYLLDRLDRFSGVVFLTTNLAVTIDRAVHRRLSAHIVVPVPGEREREALWTRLVSTGRAPLGDDIDAADLARRFPEMTGGNIRNAVLGAAYLAVAERADVITHAHLVRAGRIEYQSMGHAPRASLRTVPPEN